MLVLIMLNKFYRFLSTKVEFVTHGRDLKDYDAIVVVGEKGVSDQRVLPRFQALNAAIQSLAQVCRTD